MIAAGTAKLASVPSGGAVAAGGAAPAAGGAAAAAEEKKEEKVEEEEDEVGFVLQSIYWADWFRTLIGSLPRRRWRQVATGSPPRFTARWQQLLLPALLLLPPLQLLSPLICWCVSFPAAGHGLLPVRLSAHGSSGRRRRARGVSGPAACARVCAAPPASPLTTLRCNAPRC